ncbi:fumarylacetoacetate hydrolase family protein [soil metagenome]
MTQALYRVSVAGAPPRLARGTIEDGPRDLLREEVRLDDLLARSGAALAETLVEAPGDGRCPTEARILAPIEDQEVWCAGVTYERSRDARMEESSEPTIYDRIYDAERPELFFKAPGWRVRGPGESVGVRVDSGWDIAEPELGLVLAADGSVAGYVIGNDMSSRTIEGDNPLYLPQAKVYDAACALGPAIVPAGAVSEPVFPVRMTIRREGAVLFEGDTSTARLRRSHEDLAGHLFRALTFPRGAILLTGTGVVPESSISLREGDVVRIELGVLGVLENPVVAIG